LQLTQKLVRPCAAAYVETTGEITTDLILRNMLRTPFLAARAACSPRGPATRIAALAALLFFTCCVARSDAQGAANAHPPIDAVKILGNWYAVTSSRVAQATFADARASGVVATVQGLLTTTKVDDVVAMPARVAPLHIITEVRMHRVAVDTPAEIRFTAHLAPGEHRMLRPGAHGAAWLTERVTSWNDVVVGRQVISKELVLAAKPALVLQGMPKTLRELQAVAKYRNIAAAMTMVATAYTADTATAYPTGFTATGVAARQGVVAVDPRIIPLGSLVFVPGYGIATAADTGGAIVGHRIDLCMDSYGDAVNFGRQTILVYVLKR
jgi:3D (Asp-Asp-Asp) domain-containing protein